MHRSHLTQIMQNYFDHTDVRSRANSYAIENQLLNMTAVELESLITRIDRESRLSFQNVPINLDNGGIYYAGRVPDTFVVSDVQMSLNSVTGITGNAETLLHPYDDILPVPASIEIDTSIDAVAMTNPIIFELIGEGDSLLQSYAVKYAAPGALLIPNQLTLWLDQLGLNQVSVTVTIVGETVPQPAWFAERSKTTEILTLNSEGVAATRNRWATIDRVAVRDLPTGVRLRGWGIPFALPACVDKARPYTDPAYRDRIFPRYWVISNDNNRLEEDFLAIGFTGLEMLTSRRLTDTLVDIAVEPNTNGLFAASETSLYYLDRRESMPLLAGTGIITDPLFGLQISLDSTVEGSTPIVVLSGTPYARSSEIVQYRYTMTDPTNILWGILPDGSIAHITNDVAWRVGVPQQVSLPLLVPGSYSFTLECQDTSGVVTIDLVPYQNQAFAPLAVLDLSKIIDNVQGIAFDSYNRLWIWTGSFAIPIKIHYDAYVFDSFGKIIYTTESHESLAIF